MLWFLMRTARFSRILTLVPGVSVVWDPVTSQVFAATRAGGTVAVLNKDGKLVANIPMDDTPNHLTAAPDGAVYLVSMYGTTGDKTQTGSVTKITPKNNGLSPLRYSRAGLPGILNPSRLWDGGIFSAYLTGIHILLLETA